ncbi:MAG: hypothetical protein GX115_04550 [Ruminiclostridium sp.]|nr:hypothetical protein [Ruminiclostridium sp.]
MRKKNIIKILGVIVIAVLIVQSAAFAGSFTGQTGENINTNTVQISPEIESKIREQEPGEYNKNLANYRQMLVVLDIHNTYKTRMEEFILLDKRLPDILIAYQFLNENYGQIEELGTLLIEKESGKTWLEVFTAYRQQNLEFVPRSFDFDYLDVLMQSEGITEDDIMIADRVSQKTGLPFEDIIAQKASGKQWKDINEGFGIINAQKTLPRVPVTQEQLKKHTTGNALSEEKVVETLVIAYKLELDEQVAINKAKEGYTQERFFAEALEGKYE